MKQHIKNKNHYAAILSNVTIKEQSLHFFFLM